MIEAQLRLRHALIEAHLRRTLLLLPAPAASGSFQAVAVRLRAMFVTAGGSNRSGPLKQVVLT